MKTKKLRIGDDNDALLLSALYQVIHERFGGSLLLNRESMMQFMQKSAEGKVLIGSEEDADGNLLVKVEVMP